MQRKVLGKGLDALFTPGTVNGEQQESEQQETSTKRRIITVPVNDIIPNRDQPRERFNEDAMEELKRSIAENGILEPPIVRRKGDFYELIAGERRFRAAKELAFETIDVILMDIDSDEKMIVLSLIENIQREDLNPMEEASAYQQIMTTMDITQEELSSLIGKNRSTIANMLRLLSLYPRVQQLIRDGSLPAGSARTLIAVQDDELQYQLAQKISAEGLSTRKAETLIKRTLSQRKRRPSTQALSPFLDEIRNNLRHILGTDVKIKGNDGKGKIEIEYYSSEDLERILETLKGGPLEG